MGEAIAVTEQFQTLVAKLLATQPVGHQLCLIGGFRYRFLDASCRASMDMDYHWEGDLDRKQAEIVNVLRQRLLPEIDRLFGCEGDIRPARGPSAESPAVRVIEIAFYRSEEPGSRIAIPLEIMRIPRLDAPTIRTVAGTVFLTVSDADMIESKVLALVNRPFVQLRDVLDIFLFQDRLGRDAPQRLAQKFIALSLSSADVVKRLNRLRESESVHVRELGRILDAQVDAPAAANLRAAGGGAIIWHQVMHPLMERLIRGANP